MLLSLIRDGCVVTVITLVCVVISPPPSPGTGPYAWSETEDYVVGMPGRETCVGDFNGDGHLDIAGGPWDNKDQRVGSFTRISLLVSSRGQAG